MRNWSILILVVLVGCAKTPLDHAKKVISKNIGQYLNDPSYYESVAWGILDSALYENFYDTPKGEKLFDSCILAIPTKQNSSKIKLDITLKKEYKTLSQKIIAIDSVFINREGMSREKSFDIYRLHLKDFYAAKDSFKPFFKGYTICHTFRARGAKKEKLLMKYLFSLDSTFIITGAEKQGVETFDSSKP